MLVTPGPFVLQFRIEEEREGVWPHTQVICGSQYQQLNLPEFATLELSALSFPLCRVAMHIETAPTLMIIAWLSLSIAKAAKARLAWFFWVSEPPRSRVASNEMVVLLAIARRLASC